MTEPSVPIDVENLVSHFDLRQLDERFYADPYPYYHALRETAPRFACPSGTVLLTRYADVMQVYRDSARFSSDKKAEFSEKFGNGPLFEHHTTSLVFNDPPLHTRVRRLIVGALSSRTVKAMEPAVEELVDRLIKNLQHNPREDQFDAVDDFAALIPIEVIGNLLRVPVAEREPLRAWSLAILGALEPKITPATRQAGDRAVSEFLDYLSQLTNARRKALSDDEDDVLSRLIRGENGEQLAIIELLHNCIFILNAGHETTTNLIANGIDTFLDHPGELRQLLADRSLASSAVEEILRFQSPNQLGNRRTRCSVTIGDDTVPEGTSITLGIGAANRDPEQFPEPDAFTISRAPNRHLAFAAGSHACAGLSVARLEGRIALDRFFKFLPKPERAGPAIRNRRARFRGLASLPIKL